LLFFAVLGPDGSAPPGFGCPGFQNCAGLAMFRARLGRGYTTLASSLKINMQPLKGLG
jgi:hypothetical protein